MREQRTPEPGKPHNVTELRGLACLLLVAYHVVGAPGTGMQVDDHSIYRYATASFDLIRMPLFTFLSGFVYAYRPVAAGRFGSFLVKKLRRLGLPFLVVSTLFYLVQTRMPGANGAFAPSGMWEIYIYSYAHFWYLQALLLIFFAVGVLERAGLLARPAGFLATFAFALGAGLTVHTESNLFSVNEACVLLPHFLLGVAVCRFGRGIPRRWLLTISGLALAIAIAIHQATLLGILHQNIGWNSTVAVICGMGGAVTLLHVMPHGKLFRRIGRSSYAIYLYHAFFTAGARVALHKLGAGDATVFLGALAAGVVCPMVLEAMVSIRPITRVTLVGKA